MPLKWNFRDSDIYMGRKDGSQITPHASPITFQVWRTKTKHLNDVSSNPDYTSTREVWCPHLTHETREALPKVTQPRWGRPGSWVLCIGLCSRGFMCEFLVSETRHNLPERGPKYVCVLWKHALPSQLAEPMSWLIFIFRVMLAVSDGKRKPKPLSEGGNSPLSSGVFAILSPWPRHHLPFCSSEVEAQTKSGRGRL